MFPSQKEMIVVFQPSFFRGKLACFQLQAYIPSLKLTWLLGPEKNRSLVNLQEIPNLETTILHWKNSLLNFKAVPRVVVSNIFDFHPYLVKWSNLTNIFQMGWNHQLVPFIFGVVADLVSWCQAVQLARGGMMEEKNRSQHRGCVG